MNAIIIGLIFVLALSWLEVKGAALKKPVEVNGYQVPELWVDPETNCQYFRVTGGITPRLGTNGFPLCGFELPVGSE